jgi:hypothetical protein
MAFATLMAQKENTFPVALGDWATGEIASILDVGSRQSHPDRPHPADNNGTPRDVTGIRLTMAFSYRDQTRVVGHAA